MLRLVRSFLVCTSQRRWLHQSDVGSEDLPPTAVQETFGGALTRAWRCGQSDSVGVDIFMNRPNLHL